MKNSVSPTEIAREIHALGMALLQAGKTREAAVSFRKVLALAPDFPDAALLLGHCLHLLGEYREALAVYDRLLAGCPSQAAAWNNRGNTLLEMGRFEDAAASFMKALELLPGLNDARVALASCYQFMGMPDKAMKACEAVLSSDPGHAEAHWNRALLLLLKGEYPEGWREYEWRWRKRGFTSPQRDFSQPRWNGEPIAGKTLLVHAEQGFGDTLQFCRFIPRIAALGSKVVFECHPVLVKLMKTLDGCTDVVPMGQPLPPFDLHIPLLSLPLILGTTITTIPDNVPYLRPPAESLLAWSNLIPVGKGLKAGLCWAGKAYPDPGRSCPVGVLKPLGDIEGIVWHSLQVGWQEALPLKMTDLTPEIVDFSDTAALISQLDLVITIDTAVAHLACALGKPVWLMLPYAPDWRWMLERDDSPWYPTARIFRQKKLGEWDVLIATVMNELRK